VEMQVIYGYSVKISPDFNGARNYWAAGLPVFGEKR